MLLRKKFSYIESIPGVLLPHPSSSAYPFKVDGYGVPEQWHFQGAFANPNDFCYDHHHHFNNNHQPLKQITPSMSSLEALLSKLPSVVPPHHQGTSSGYNESQQPQPSQHYVSSSSQRALELMGSAKEEVTDEEFRCNAQEVGESSNFSMSAYDHDHQQYHHHNHMHHQNLDVTDHSRSNDGY